jgi:hypothetical protein
MAGTAKSGGDWTSNDLESYNIEIVGKKEQEFFGLRAGTLPPNLHKGLLTYKFSYGEEVPCKVSKLMSYPDLASTSKEGQESMVDDFTLRHLDAIG